MGLELYFLRASEQKIVSDMLFYSQRVNEVSKRVEDFKALSIYEDFYGFTTKDLGLYAMKDNVVSGAIWSRKLNADHNSNAFLDEDTPVLNIAVKPEFRNKGIAKEMIEQFLQEAAALYNGLSVSVVDTKENRSFFEKFGFEKAHVNSKKSYVDNLDAIVMLKKLEKKSIQRPSDNYDPSYWMD
jgi:ribosomal protein S18 acetylase RimI-like enzyme